MRTSVVVTTNLSLGGWATVFGGSRMTTALPHRVAHHRHILEIINDASASSTAPPKPLVGGGWLYPRMHAPVVG